MQLQRSMLPCQKKESSKQVDYLSIANIVLKLHTIHTLLWLLCIEKTDVSSLKCMTGLRNPIKKKKKGPCPLVNFRGPEPYLPTKGPGREVQWS